MLPRSDRRRTAPAFIGPDTQLAALLCAPRAPRPSFHHQRAGRFIPRPSNSGSFAIFAAIRRASHLCSEQLGHSLCSLAVGEQPLPVHVFVRDAI
jgi:hypothetical protein